MDEENNFQYTPLQEPIAITEQVWPEGTAPLVHSRTMTYNHENYIRDCIEGILMQKTTFPVQVLIHDDASTDKTPEIVQEYQQKYPRLIKTYYQTENSYSKPDKHERRTEFMSWRLGRYEALCEGDDYWTDPYKLQKQVDFLESNPDYSICFHNVKILKNGALIDDNITRDVPETTDIYDLAKGNYIHTPSVVFRRELKDFPDWISKCPAGDYPMHMINAQYGKIKKFKETMAVYRIHDSNMWVSQDSIKMDLKIHDYLDAMIGNFQKDVELHLKNRYFNISAKLIKNFWATEDYENAKLYFERLFNKVPELLTEHFVELSVPKTATYHCNALKEKVLKKIFHK